MADSGSNMGYSFEAPTGDERRLIDVVIRHLGDSDLLMTSAFEDDRTGTRLLSAARCSVEPPLVVVAARKGHSIEPLIRDSRGFAVCILRPDDKLMARKFPPLGPKGEPTHQPPALDEEEGRADPFDALPMDEAKTGAPIPKRSIAALDCEVVRHFDLEADHELYVGLVVAARDFAGLGGGGGQAETSSTDDRQPGGGGAAETEAPG